MPVTPNMNLTLPVVSSTAGPTWATYLNTAFGSGASLALASASIDAHDHTSGKGVLVPSAGIGINADLSFASYNATTLRTVRVNSQSAVLSVGTDINCYYAVNGAPYFNTSSGAANQLVGVTVPLIIGDTVYASTTTGFAKLAIGTSGQVYKVVGGIPSWGSAQSSFATTTTKTTTYQILNTDDYLQADTSGGGFTMTLPDCATNAGKAFYIKKITSDFSVLTLSRAGADTIQDFTTAATSTTLNTQGEELEIVAAGSTIWQIKSRRIPSVLTAYTPTFTGLGTIASVAFFYKRVGDSIVVQGNATTGTCTAAGVTISLPSGLTSDSAKTPSGNQMVGSFGRTANQTGPLYIILPGGGSVSLQASINTAGSLTGNVAGTALIGDAEAFSVCTNPVPISGWKA